MTSHEEFESIAALEALGAASADEVQRLHEHADNCPQCADVLAELDTASALIGLSLEPVAPPANIRARVLAVTAAAPVTHRSFFPQDRYARWFAAAAVFFLALFGWSELRLKAAQEKIAEIQSSARALSEENRRLSGDGSSSQARMAMLAGPQTKTFFLAGQQVAPAATARAFVDPGAGRVVVFFHQLPVTPTGKSYQLWIIRADQAAPQSAGTFEVGPSGSAEVTMQNLPLNVPIAALAVTLEPRGGMPAPTGEKYLVGS